jgi:hypothetical protein
VNDWIIDWMAFANDLNPKYSIQGFGTVACGMLGSRVESSALEGDECCCYTAWNLRVPLTQRNSCPLSGHQLLKKEVCSMELLSAITFSCKNMNSQDSSVVYRRTTGWTAGVQFPSMDKFYLFPVASIQALGPSFLPSGYLGLFPRG